MIFRLHTGGQLAMAQDRHRFKVAACGRRWGKTVVGAAEASKHCTQGGKRYRALWVSPTHDQNQEAVSIIREALADTGVFEYRLSDRRMDFVGGSRLYFRSAERPQHLRGRGWDLVVVDEAAFIPDSVWQDTLRPSLMLRKGRGIFLSTPNGRQGFFHTMFQRGQKTDENPEVQSWHFPSWTNPMIVDTEIEALREELPQRAFDQEVGAEFLAGEGVVFRTIPIEDYPCPCPPRGAVAIGLDLAKHQDWTVAIAIDETGHIVDMLRFHQLEWQTQIRLAVDFAKKYVAPVYVDATGLGDVVYDLVNEKYKGLVIPIVFSNPQKRALIENLVVAFEQRRVTIPQVLEALIGELKAFSLKLRGTTLTYSAPPGLHDDCVIALALAVWAWAQAPVEFERVGGSLL